MLGDGRKAHEELLAQLTPEMRDRMGLLQAAGVFGLFLALGQADPRMVEGIRDQTGQPALAAAEAALLQAAEQWARHTIVVPPRELHFPTS